MITSRQIISISEKYSTSKNVSGRDVVIYEDPDGSDVKEISKTINSDKLIRFIADATTQKVYVWDANLAIHSDVVKILGLGSYSSNLNQATNFLFGYAKIIGNNFFIDLNYSPVEYLPSTLTYFYKWLSSSTKMKPGYKAINDVIKDLSSRFSYNWSFLNKSLPNLSQYINTEKVKFLGSIK